MSSKLYPPTLSNIIPAFYKGNYGNGDSTIITVPYTMNRTTSISDIDGFSLIFKSVANNRLLLAIETDAYSIKNLDQSKVSFVIPNSHWTGGWEKLRVGQFYKVQLAYKRDTDLVGHYSNAAIIKYTGQPTISLESMSAGGNNASRDIYVGVYNPPSNDILEKAYSYRFDIYDKKGQLFLTSGERLHNSFEDVSYNESKDTFVLPTSLPENETFQIKYSVTTINKLEISSMGANITEMGTIDPEVKVKVIAKPNFEHGYIRVGLQGDVDARGQEPAIIGSFILKRACSKNNFSNWETICNFLINGDIPSNWHWKDFTVEQGYSYKYGLQQYNDSDLFSSKIESTVVEADFEDCFLYDGEKQLRIKYNPKMSSFKNTILESKIDTLGNKYPYFFRNGNVSYKEFPISGLISYLSDSENLFLTDEEILKEQNAISLDGDNITSERIFKMKVLEWLNNGKPKLFRSATEGNFIVRLMNVSLAPNDTLGRMLHTFTATAYEVNDFTYDALLEQGFLTLMRAEEEYTTRWAEIQLSQVTSYNTNLLEHVPATSLLIQDVIPGSKFRVIFEGTPEEMVIEVGPTGVYRLDLKDNVNITSLKSFENNGKLGSVLYSYRSQAQNVFNTIVSIAPSDYWIFSNFIGETQDIIAEIEEVFDCPHCAGGKLSGLRTKLMDFDYLRFSAREVYDIFCKTDPAPKNDLGQLTPIENAVFYWDREYSHQVTKFEQDVYLYKVHYLANGVECIKYLDRQANRPDKYSEELSYHIILDKGKMDIDITTTLQYEIPAIDTKSFSSLYIGNGVICEACYMTKTVVYGIETEEYGGGDYSTLIQAKKEYLAAEQAYSDAMSSMARIDLTILENIWREKKLKYLKQLHDDLEAMKEASGVYV